MSDVRESLTRLMDLLDGVEEDVATVLQLEPDELDALSDVQRQRIRDLLEKVATKLEEAADRLDESAQ